MTTIISRSLKHVNDAESNGHQIQNEYDDGHFKKGKIASQYADSEWKLPHPQQTAATIAETTGVKGLPPRLANSCRAREASPEETVEFMTVDRVNRGSNERVSGNERAICMTTM